MEPTTVWTAEPGAAVEVLPRRKGAAPWWDGTLAESRGFDLEVTVAPGCELEPHEDVILAGGATGARAAVLARFKEMRGDVAVFKRMSPWRPVDSRAFVRFPVELRAVVVGEHEDSPRHGWTLDISRGGLAVQVEGTLASDVLEVTLGEPGTPGIPCRVVAKRESVDGMVLHLSFEEMGEAELACINALVDELSAALELAAAS